MRYVPIRELNRRTRASLAEAASGVAVTVTRGGRPTARLIPVSGTSDVLDELVALGKALAPTVHDVVPLPPVYGDPATDSAAALLAGRLEAGM